MTDLSPIVKRCAGLDIHRRIIVATILCEESDGTVKEETREFGTFRKHRQELTQWLQSQRIELTVMESTGVYHKAIYKDLEKAGLLVQLVNARYVKQVPGRKTDVKDSQWLASLARFGLLKGSFVPPVDLREIRLITRYRSKQQSILASEKNRLHKILDDSGIRLSNPPKTVGQEIGRRMQTADVQEAARAIGRELFVSATGVKSATGS